MVVRQCRPRARQPMVSNVDTSRQLPLRVGGGAPHAAPAQGLATAPATLGRVPEGWQASASSMPRALVVYHCWYISAGNH